MAEEDGVTLDLLYEGLTSLVGEDRAREVVSEAITSQGMIRKQRYTKGEVKRICDALRQQGGMIAVVASAILPRLILR